ncbi:MAG TPA: hypothetical protein VEA41_18415, partial [Salinarimonas sp.]|nr:hypothetical protein [Salinarimonas sp.]
VEGQYIAPSRGLKLIGIPDLEKFEDQESAVEDLVQKMIDCALLDGKFIAPEPYLGPVGLQLLIDQAIKEYLRAQTLPASPPEEHLELLRRLIEQAKLQLAEAQPPAPPPALPGAPAAVAPPAALPPVPQDPNAAPIA